MIVPDLETLRDDLEFGLERFRSLPRPAQPDAEYADACLLAWRRCRQLGITLLLSEADGATFREHILAGARIRRDLLAFTSSNPDAFVEYRRAGDLAGFADALVANEIELAVEIATECADSWSVGYEYEDDFWYAKVLHRLVTGGFAVDDVLRDHLDQLQQAAENESTGQVLVASALTEADPDAFGEALMARVDEFQELWTRRGEGLLDDPDGYASERHIFIEGLALKAIGRRMGFPVVEDEPLMPREAWLGTSSTM